jgi:hypothetical protein
MSDDKTVIVPKETGVAPLEATSELAVERKPATAADADEARTVAVSELLTTAYAQASNLRLTEAESKALRVPFDDSVVRGGARGDERLLYISHIHLSDRLTDVLGIGQWALVKRSQRAEKTQDNNGKPLIRLYYEGVLLIRGAFVTEAVGVGQYHPHNPKEDYGTALESAMSDCLTRCAKRIGVGSQIWDKGYCDSWLAKKRSPVRMPVAEAAPASSEAPRDKADAPSLVEQITERLKGKSQAQAAKAMNAAGIDVAGGEAWQMAAQEKLATLLSLLKC